MCVFSHLVGIMVTELHFGNGITITELQVFFSCTINHNKKLIMEPKYIRVSTGTGTMFQLNMYGIFGLNENCPWIQKHALFVTCTICKKT